MNNYFNISYDYINNYDNYRTINPHKYGKKKINIGKNY